MHSIQNVGNLEMTSFAVHVLAASGFDSLGRLCTRIKHIVLTPICKLIGHPLLLVANVFG
jgi:hypothetical protein